MELGRFAIEDWEEWVARCNEERYADRAEMIPQRALDDLRDVSGQSPRGSWRYVAWSPPLLAGLVDHVWSYVGPTVDVGKRVFPNGRVELLINLSEPYREVGLGALPRVWISGLRAAPTVLHQPAQQDVVAARLQPAGAYALLGCPAREVTDLSVELADLVGHAAATLEDRLAALSCPVARLRALGAWLGERMRIGQRQDPAVAWAMSAVERSAGAVAIADLRERTGLSKPRLVAAFRDQVGLTPKRYARVVRFRRALAQMGGDAPCLAALAADCGFYDQAHMNAEFRALGGVTPRAYLATRHAVGGGATASDPL